MSYAGKSPTYDSVKVGNMVIIGDAIYTGDPDTNGTWKIEQVGANLEISVREVGVYVPKDTIEA